MTTFPETTDPLVKIRLVFFDIIDIIYFIIDI